MAQENDLAGADNNQESAQDTSALENDPDILEAVARRSSGQTEPQDAVDPDIADALQRREQKSIRSNRIKALYEADRFGIGERGQRVIRMAEKTGLHPDVIDANLDKFSKAAEVSEYDTDRLERDYPDLVETLLEHQHLAGPILKDPALRDISEELRTGEVASRVEPGSFVKRGLTFAADAVGKLGSAMESGFAASSQAEVGRKMAGSAALFGDEKLAGEAKKMQAASEESANKAISTLESVPEARKPNIIQTVTAPEAKLEGVERLKILPAAYKYYRRDHDASVTAFKVMIGKIRGQDVFENEKKLVAMEQELGDVPWYGQGPAMQLGLDAVQAFASNPESLGAQALGAAAGLGVGRMFGPMAGRKAAKVVGRALGYTASFVAEGGSAYRQFKKVKGPDGELDEPTLIGATIFYAAIASAIEVGGNEAELRMLGPIGDKLVGLEKKEVARWLASDGKFRTLLKEAGKRWSSRLVAGMYAEGKEEAQQQTLQNVIDYALKLKMGETSGPDVAAMLGDAGGAFVAGGIGAAGLGPIGYGSHVVGMSIERAQQSSSAQQVSAVHKGTQTQLAKASPAGYAKVVEKATGESGAPVTHMYADAEQLLTLFQEAGQPLEQAATDLLGPDGYKRINAAIVTGSKLEIPVGEWAAKIATKPLGDALVNGGHVIGHAFMDTPAQAAQKQASIQTEAKALVERAKSEQATDAEREFMQVVQSQLLKSYEREQTGKDGKTRKQHMKVEDSAASVEQLASVVVTMAKRSGVPVEDMMRQYVVTVQRHQDGAQQAEAAQQQPPVNRTEASGILERAYREMDDEGKRNLYYRDATTDLLHERGIRDMPADEARPNYGVLSFGYKKDLNDVKGKGHDFADDVFRDIAKALHEIDPNAGKVGGDLWLPAFGDQAEMDALIEQLRSKLPEGLKDIPLVGTVMERKAGEDWTATKHRGGDTLSAHTDTKRSEGKFPKREDRLPETANVQPSKTRLGTKGRALQVPLVERHGTFNARKAAEEAYFEKETGALTKAGWDEVRRRAPKDFVVSADIRAVKAMDVLFGHEITDEMVRKVVRSMVRRGGNRFDVAHVSGDEIRAQGNSEQELKAFFEEVRSLLGNAHEVMELDDSSILEQEGLHYAYGLAGGADAEHQADGVELPAAKQREEAAGRGKAYYAAKSRIHAPDSERAKQLRAEAAKGRPNPELDAGGRGATYLAHELSGLDEEVGQVDPRGPGRPHMLFQPSPNIYEQPAWHGSPHRGIEQTGFSLQKIGTGEGAQAYGWGMYFAGDKAVGEFYRKTLANRAPVINDGERTYGPNHNYFTQELHTQLNSGASKGDALLEARLKADREYKRAKERYDKVANNPVSVTKVGSELDLADAEAMVRLWGNAKALADRTTVDQIQDAQGQLYSVDVPESDRLLDYDRPMAEQPPSVLKALREAGLAVRIDDESGREKIRLANGERVESEEATGAMVYRALSERWGNEQAASEALNKVGIPGLRYLDGNSRGSGEGNYNFVIWDENEIRDIKTYYEGKESDSRGYVQFVRKAGQLISNVFLKKNSDLSTFLHESGHIYLEMLGDLSERADAPQQIKDDYATILREFGVQSRAEVGTEQHEKFAKLFEAYLLEGKAPSLSLKGAFKRFSNWLKRIYGSLKDAGLNDEVRAVFDRMLATDEEIEAAKDEAGMRPMFRSPEEAGMQPGEWQAYLEAQEAAHSKAELAARLRELKAELREANENLRPHEASAVAEAAKEFDALPETRAAEYVKTGRVIGEDGSAIEAGKLDRQDVVESVGEEAAAAIEEKLRDAIAEKRLARRGKRGSRSTSVITPQNKSGEAATYKVIEAKDLLPSHSPTTFQPTKGYPAEVQEREYHRQPEEQAKVVSGAQALNPSLLLANTPSAVDGPPLVTSGKKHLVLGGNGRSMMMLRGFSNKEQLEAYRSALIDRASSFGMSAKEIARMDAPVLVRVIDGVSSDAPKSDLQAAVRRFNEGMTQALSPRAKAVAEARMLSSDSVQDLAGLLSDDSSLRDAMRDRPQDIAKILRRDGIVTDQNQAQWLAGGNLTDEAKDRIEGMFLGRVVGTGDRLAAAAPELLKKIERAVPHLIRVAGINGALDEIETVQQAMDLLADAKRRKLSLQDLLRQPGLFGEATVFGDDARTMASLLDGATQKKVSEAFKRWASVAAVDPRQATMFEKPATLEFAEDVLFDGVERMPPAPKDEPAKKGKAQSGAEIRPPSGLWRGPGEEGPSLDEMAGVLGFPDGKAMADALENHPDRDSYVAARSKAILEERLGPMLTDRDALAAEVSKGLHGDHTADWLIAEWRALERKARPGKPSVPLESIKRAARELANDAQAGAINVGRARQAERMAAKRAMEAAAKGDVERAVFAKQQQLLNFYLARELEDAKDDFDRVLKIAEDMAGDRWQSRMGKAAAARDENGKPTNAAKAAVAYRDAIETIFEALNLAEPQERDKQPHSIHEAVRAMEQNEGIVAKFDADALAMILYKPRDMRVLSVGEMRNALTALKQFQQAFRNAETTIVDGKKYEKDEIKARITNEIRAALPMRPTLSSSTPTEGRKPTLRKMAGDALEARTKLGFAAGNNWSESWLNRAIFKPLKEAQARENDLINGACKSILDAMDRMPDKVKRHLGDSIDGNKLFPTHRSGARSDGSADIKAPTKRFELLMMAANSGNSSNMDRLTKGRGITEAEVWNALLDGPYALTKEEWDWVQSIWDANEALKPLAFDVEERVSGIRPDEIEARQIVTRHGTYRGGYIPAVYDRRGNSSVAERQAVEYAADVLDQSYSTAHTSHSNTKSRAENFADVIALDPSVFQAHISQAAHDIAFREPLMSVSRLLLDSDLQREFKERLGTEWQRQFLPWLKDIGNDRNMEVMTHGAFTIARALRMAKAGLGLQIMAFNFKTFFGDTPGIVLNSFGLSKTDYAMAIKDVAGGWGYWGNFIDQKSGWMRSRKEGWSRELSDEINRAFAGMSFANNPYMTFQKKYGYVVAEAIEKAVLRPAWLAAYRIKLKELAGRTDLSVDDMDRIAVDFAEDKASRWVPPKYGYEKSALLRDKGAVGMIVFMGGFFNRAFQRNAELAHVVYLASTGHIKGKEAAKQVAKAVATGIAMAMIYGPLSEWLSGRGPEPEDGDDDWERYRNWFLRKTAMAPLLTVPIVGPIAESGLSPRKMSPRASPGVAAIYSFWEAVNESKNGDDQDRASKAWLRAAGSLGLGVQNVRMADYLMEGEFEVVDEPVEFIEGLLYGKRDNQPLNPLRPLSD